MVEYKLIMEYKKLIIIYLLVIFCENTLGKCDNSSTTVNGNKIKCKNELIFEENFNRLSVDNDYAEEDNYEYLNSSVWKREIKIPLDPVIINPNHFIILLIN